MVSPIESIHRGVKSNGDSERRNDEEEVRTRVKAEKLKSFSEFLHAFGHPMSPVCVLIGKCHLETPGTPHRDVLLGVPDAC